MPSRPKTRSSHVAQLFKATVARDTCPFAKMENNSFPRKNESIAMCNVRMATRR
eukprot:CAMPEP_0167797198 /NCGR_PEP_ID=MMETSP0111_2-20121227/15502_1 /TAXON_ID=91324 /ORGANISM="Lotharella globosa, Strain CCCM811" /LENGTH=53 /DNA_ID=CAMNT_0007691239 /DNA_START=141 /DNA_END=299 /DNA_ORIENTATION=-